MTEAPDSRTDGAGRPRPATTPSVDRWAPLWFALARIEWRALAIVPAHADSPTADVAQALCDVAAQFGEPPVMHLAAEHAVAGGVRQLLDLMALRKARGERTIVSLSSALTDLGTIPLARACDGVLLLTPLGLARVDDARRTIDMIGRELFIGGVTFDPAPQDPSASA